MERAFQQFAFAVGQYLNALRFIFSKNLAWFFVFPLVINALLFLSGFSAISGLAENIQAYLNIEGAEFWGAAFIAGIVSVLIWLLSVFVLVYFGGYITLIIMSPVLAILSEKTEKIYSGNEYATDAEQIVRDVLRGIRLALRNLFKEILWIIFILFASMILGVIPIIGWVLALGGQVFLFLLASYFYGFSFMDYMSERRRLSFDESILFVKQNKGLAIGNGFVFSLSLMIPVVGGFVASFFSVISVVAATLSMLELEKEGKLKVPNSEQNRIQEK